MPLVPTDLTSNLLPIQLSAQPQVAFKSPEQLCLSRKFLLFKNLRKVFNLTFGDCPDHTGIKWTGLVEGEEARIWIEWPAVVDAVDNVDPFWRNGAVTGCRTKVSKVFSFLKVIFALECSSLTM